MTNKEVFKPSNTGWLIADVVRDNHAFIWSRTEPDPQMLALLNDPQWQPYLVFPGEYVEPERVTNTVAVDSSKRPLFILLDATWTEARKIFRKSPYFDACRFSACCPTDSRAIACVAPPAASTCAPPKWRRCAWIWPATARRRRRWTRISMCSASITCAKRQLP
jgi:hypothetical protein